MTEPETVLETQVRTALRRAGEQAPSARRLADAVRARRARARRTTTWGVSGLVAALVALVLVLPVVLGGGPDDEPPAASDADPGWRTVTLESDDALAGGTVAVDVPDDWVPLDPGSCLILDQSWGPRGQNPCRGGDHVSLVTAGVDRSGLPGTFLRTGGRLFGHARTGTSEVEVVATDRATARRILASARPAGDPAPEVRAWTTERPGQGVAVEVPRGGEVEVEVPPGDPFCARGRTPAARGSDGQWRAGLCRDRIVTVTAPTQALADVVAATVRGY